MARSEAASMPPMTALPSTRRDTAPAPVAAPQRHTSKNESKRSHQYRPQTQSGREQGRLFDRFAFVKLHFCEFDDQNRIFRGQSDQHHQTDLRVHVVFQSSHPEKPERAENRDRRSQQHAEGQ